MDIGRSFSFVFQDERWLTKVLLGGLIAIIPFIGQLVILGYLIKVAQNVARGSELPLPEWGEFGAHLARGFYSFVIFLVYFLPDLILYFVFIGITAAAGATANSDSAEQVGGGIAALALCLLPIILILGIVLSLLAYTALARYAVTDTLSEAFKFGEVWASLRSNIGSWIVFLLVAILASIVGQLGIIACGIGVLFTAAYAYIVIGHALGQTIIKTGIGGPVAPPSYTPPSF